MIHRVSFCPQQTVYLCAACVKYTEDLFPQHLCRCTFEMHHFYRCRIIDIYIVLHCVAVPNLTVLSVLTDHDESATACSEENQLSAASG